MENLFLNIDAGTIDWSRAQFALTAIFHWLFVPLTLGMALIMGIAETCYYRTGKVFWKDTAKFWQKLFGINFAMGVATGIILEFEFGTNWSNYSWFVGDIFGAPLAVEGIVAFFMESTFVAVMFFGWNKVSRGFHLASTWLTGLGATISAWWILVANAWMQYPVGCAFNPDTMRNEMVSFAEVALSPFAVDKFCHTVISSWIIGAAFCVGVSCWYLLKRREQKLAVESIKIGALVGLVASVLAAATGHQSAQRVGEVQPMKLAAMEALYKSTCDGICIVSNDSDFTALAAKIREGGKAVYGLGGKKTPESFRVACTQFLEMPVKKTDPPQKKAASSTCPRCGGALTVSRTKSNKHCRVCSGCGGMTLKVSSLKGMFSDDGINELEHARQEQHGSDQEGANAPDIMEKCFHTRSR